MKVTTASIRKLKGKRPIVAITAYDCVTASLASQSGVDIILIGDSVGNAVLGFDTTVPVTVDMMLHHTAAVARARPDSLVVGDIPFGEAACSFDALLATCRRFMQEAGAEAVKLEGGAALAEKVSGLVTAGIPVLGHIGLHPQRFYAMGGYRRFGRKEQEREQLKADALALQDAGAFAVIGEMIDPGLSAEITAALEVPFIGIGCGPDCDGQILVCNDILGLSLTQYPSFSRQYANLTETIKSAFTAYAQDVRGGEFPASPDLKSNP